MGIRSAFLGWTYRRQNESKAAAARHCGGLSIGVMRRGHQAAWSAGCKRGNDASRARSSESLVAGSLFPIRIGAGRYPAFCHRWMVIRLLLYRRRRSELLRNRSPSSPCGVGGFVAPCDMPRLSTINTGRSRQPIASIGYPKATRFSTSCIFCKRPLHLAHALLRRAQQPIRRGCSCHASPLAFF